MSGFLDPESSVWRWARNRDGGTGVFQPVMHSPSISCDPLDHWDRGLGIEHVGQSIAKSELALNSRFD